MRNHGGQKEVTLYFLNFVLLNFAERKKCKPRSLYFVKISFKKEGEIKTFSNEVKLTEFIASRPALKNC